MPTGSYREAIALTARGTFFTAREFADARGIPMNKAVFWLAAGYAARLVERRPIPLDERGAAAHNWYWIRP